MSARLLHIRGLVQGVGFRPYVWRLAGELGIAGWVRNDGDGVTLLAAGARLDDFLARLPREIPPLARIDAIDSSASDERPAPGFVIRDSVAGAVRTAIGPDSAICPDCIADLCDPTNRRWRYAFTTCTHCGPRHTVSAGIPYDRARTSLAAFPLCAPCTSEYTDPADRRFHAETTCCPDCGPQLQLLDENGADLTVDRQIPAKTTDPIAATLALLRAGRIVAIKGLGGFHLACDARNPDAVAELRRRKAREAKPFAVMGLNPGALAAFAEFGDGERALFADLAAPIVLCRKGAGELAGVAPGLPWLGVMRPATPLHLLLWHEAAGRPAGTAWLAEENDLLLVMTSANPQGEPLVTGNAEALQRLNGIADAFLMHDRDIVVRCDDSVVRVADGAPAFLRRARGYVPLPIALTDDGPPVLALGAHLKNAVCVLRGREAFVSQHIGSLDNAATLAFLEETVAHLLAVLDVKPALIAHDLHPDYASTALALRLAGEFGVPARAVGHHHAHIGAICAEHGVNGPLLGLALDGVGLGPDGGAWGGELLRVDGADCHRLGHLRPLALPGGDRAAREPWRMAIAALHGAGLGDQAADWLARTWPEREAGPLLTLLDRQLRCPPTSSLGRWFDAAAGLLGVRDVSRYEGQAAMELEGRAAAHGPVEPLAGGWRIAGDILDFSPLLPALLDSMDAGQGAALFHATVAAGLAEWAMFAVDREKLAKMAVGGGCAANAILLDALRRRLTAAGIEVLEARAVPAGDGGLALGQAWVARQMHGDKA
ncbi:hydrogenase maturation protein HypF [Azonexus fungiphilus]|uniref:Carbamoyltransferase HypF n=1 Tax=Azonexus fungiphilus TaxID=146940 RepID=A0A495VR11_9RHOO|nr:carbamoyltransferase HypF [Azonexus fungiphilus]RKT51330.1 hydrogenase maturation protein HypF [Azonexus fungiphilus]